MLHTKRLLTGASCSGPASASCSQVATCLSVSSSSQHASSWLPTMLQEQLLKLVPQQQQIQYYGGTPVDFGVRVGTSLVVTLAASKIPLLAAGTLFYPFWWPIYKAWAQNQKIRQYRYVCVQKAASQNCHGLLMYLLLLLLCSNITCAVAEAGAVPNAAYMRHWYGGSNAQLCMGMACVLWSEKENLSIAVSHAAEDMVPCPATHCSTSIVSQCFTGVCSKAVRNIGSQLLHCL